MSILGEGAEQVGRAVGRAAKKGALKKMKVPPRGFKKKPGEISGSEFMKWLESEMPRQKTFSDMPYDSNFDDVLAVDATLANAPEYEQAYMQLERFKQKYPDAYEDFRQDWVEDGSLYEGDDYSDLKVVPSIMSNFSDMEAAGVSRADTARIADIVKNPGAWMRVGTIPPDSAEGVMMASRNEKKRIYKKMGDAFRAARAEGGEDRVEELAEIMAALYRDNNPEFIESAQLLLS